MISRLTTCAAAFACITTTTIAWAAHANQVELRGAHRATIDATLVRGATPVVHFETVVVIGRRSAVTERN